MSIPDLARLQAGFRDYLVSGADEALPAPLIRSANGIDAVRRLDVYRNAYHIRLQAALAHDFPALLACMGDEAFGREMAGYLRAHPSSSPSLRDLGRRLPAYLASRGKFCWADLARIEWAVLEAFDAADAEVSTPDDLRRTPPPEWQDLHFGFHPSVTLLKVQRQAFESWSACRKGQPLPENPRHETVPLLVWRGIQGPVVRPLSVECHRLLATLGAGCSFGQACEALLSLLAPDAIAQTAAACLYQWLENGCLVMPGTMSLRVE